MTATSATVARIALKVLDERIRPHLPACATPGSAGMDLRACIAQAFNQLLPEIP